MLCLRSITHETRPREKRIAKKQKTENQSTNAVIPPTPASRPQIKTAQQPDQLCVVKLYAFLVVGGRQELERASLQPLVPNTKTIAIPKQDFHPVAIAIHEQE
jgi:hypothetical protein